ncbi:MAG: hypothetical protein KatS3mg026_0500 [Bacteroidia bacterium]|nr:MAG: hypothetical protein KatS3mg026_0500 [Bacteroidia bacterium]
MGGLRVLWVGLACLWAQRWESVAGGTDRQVEVLYPWQGALYVGGRFTTVGGAGGLQAQGIARYTSSGWQTVGGIGAGGNGQIYAMVEYGGKLIVGGDFSGIGTSSAQNLAAYDPATGTWSAVGGGVNGPVRALAVYDGELLVGGDFTQVNVAGASPLYYAFFARWNGSQWLAPDPSNPSYLLTGGSPRAFIVFQNKLYLVGNFTAAYYNETDKAYIAIWDKAQQKILPAYAPGQGPDNNIWCAALWQGSLYLGGDLTTFGSATGKVVRFDGSRAYSVTGAPTSGSVRALLATPTDLYVAGSFTQAGGQTVNRVAKLSSTGTWSALDRGLGPTIVNTLAWYNGTLYAGGGFTTDGAGNALPYIARFASGVSALPHLVEGAIRLSQVGPGAYLLSVESPLHLTRLQLFNAMGQVVYESEGLRGPGASLALPVLSPGVYGLRAQTEEGQLFFLRFAAQ